ncbi:hypothetical protein ACUSIJ_07095 [Pseudochelatococcus sp. B33]
MTDGNSGNNNDTHTGDSGGVPGLSFAAVVGEDDQVLLKARSSHGETALPLSGEQAALLGRALLTASVALRAGASRPPVGTPVDDCQFPVLRWVAARSNRNGLPLISVVLPGGIGITLQLEDQTLAQCGESLVKLASTQPSAPGGLPPVI